MGQIKCKEKRSGKHDAQFEGMLVEEQGELKFVQVNDYGEIIAEKTLMEAFANFLDKDVKVKIEETEKDEVEIEHKVKYLVDVE